MSPDSLKARTLLLTSSLVVSLGIGEVGLRIIRPELGSDIFLIPREVRSSPYHYDDEIGYEYRPYAVMDSGERRNRDGFRGPDREIPKPTGTYRILVIGDSVVEWGDRYENTWSYVLENLLNRQGYGEPSGTSYEVVNAGVGGYTSRDALSLLLRRGLRYEPDLVLVLVGWNDLVYSSRPEWVDSCWGVYARL